MDGNTFQRGKISTQSCIANVNSRLFLSIRRSIGGSGGGGGAPGARPPPRVQILLFWHAKFSKCSRLGGPRPPPTEILDPPLRSIQEYFHVTPSFFQPDQVTRPRVKKTVVNWGLKKQVDKTLLVYDPTANISCTYYCWPPWNYFSFNRVLKQMLNMFLITWGLSLNMIKCWRGTAVKTV